MLIITGYPSIPNAAAAMRLGACDYVTKPFTSEEITSAVQRVLATRRILEGNGDRPEEDAAALAAESPMLFWGDSWFRLEVDGSACVGAVLPGLHAVDADGGTVATNRRGGLSRTAAGERHRARAANALGGSAGIRRGDGGQRTAAQAFQLAEQRSLQRGLDRSHLHHGIRS